MVESAYQFVSLVGTIIVDGLQACTKHVDLGRAVLDIKVCAGMAEAVSFNRTNMHETAPELLFLSDAEMCQDASREVHRHCRLHLL